jgi:peroxiredoxin family protein
MADLLILAHGGTWDMRFQTTSLAASVAAVGERVDVALFFGALDAWARGWSRWPCLLSPRCSPRAGPTA